MPKGLRSASADKKQKQREAADKDSRRESSSMSLQDRNKEQQLLRKGGTSKGSPEARE